MGKKRRAGRGRESAEAMADKAGSDGMAQPPGMDRAPIAAAGKDVFAAIAAHGDPTAEPAEPSSAAPDDATSPVVADGTGKGYFWITLAGAFVGPESADAGPFRNIEAAFAAGRDLARRAGQTVYSMAEFDADGHQLSPTTVWSAENPEAPQNDEAASDETPAEAKDAAADESDPVQALFGRSALDEDEPPAPSSHWARRKRRRMARNPGRSK